MEKDRTDTATALGSGKPVEGDDMFNRFNNNAPIDIDPDDVKTGLKIVPLVALILVVIFLLFDSVYNVSEQKNAVVTMFGTVIRTDTAGLHFKLPLIQQVHKVDITTQGKSIGYDNSDGAEKGSHEETADGVMITSDFNLLNIDFYMEYKVSDPVAYLYNSENPEGILENIARASIRSVVSNYTVDEAITTGKSQIQADIKTSMIKELEKQNIGMQIVNITIQDSRPPTDEINQAFKAVETAKQGADTAKNNALQYQNEQLPAAEAEADRIVQEATATKESRIAEAEGQVARFNEMYKQYVNAPDITKKRLFYETMEDILPDLKVIVTDGKTETLMPLDSFTSKEKTEVSADE